MGLSSAFPPQSMDLVMGFELADSIYYCIANNKVVLLDLRRDRYFALPEELERAFKHLAGGVGLHAGDQRALTALSQAGVLKRVQDDVPMRAPPFINVPTTSLIEQGEADVKPFLAICALLSQCKTALELRERGLFEAIGQIQVKRTSREPERIDIGECARRATAFNSTKQLIATQDRCLRRSIALLNFLRGANFHPNLVIGVKMLPFGAHAWVQDGRVVLNDMLDHVTTPYTPILVI